MIAWGIKGPDESYAALSFLGETDAWLRLKWGSHQSVESLTNVGYRAVRVEVREVEQNAAQGESLGTPESGKKAPSIPAAAPCPRCGDTTFYPSTHPCTPKTSYSRHYNEGTGAYEYVTTPAAPTHDALADVAPIGYARKQDLLEYKPIVAMYDKPISPENGHAPVKLYSEDQVLHLLSALRQSGAGRDNHRARLAELDYLLISTGPAGQWESPGAHAYVKAMIAALKERTE